MERRIDPEVPLAHQSRGIARSLERLCHCRFFEREPESSGRRPRKISFVAESLLVATGHEAGARWAALWARDVTAGESHAVGGERVNIGRQNVRAALDTQVRVAEIVRDDENDVGALVRSGRFWVSTTAAAARLEE